MKKVVFLGVLFVVATFGTLAHANLGAAVTVAVGQPLNIDPGVTTQLEIT